jgi:hypothetical protein
MIPNSIMILALRMVLDEREQEESGICFNLRAALLGLFDRKVWQASPETIDWLDKMSGKSWALYCYDNLFVHWPKVCNKEPLYPIAGGRKAYAKSTYALRQWDPSSKYGALRIELCNFCIEYLEKQDEKASSDRPDDTGRPAVN